MKRIGRDQNTHSTELLAVLNEYEGLSSCSLRTETIGRDQGSES